jgi:hypothetical protein
VPRAETPAFTPRGADPMGWRRQRQLITVGFVATTAVLVGGCGSGDGSSTTTKAPAASSAPSFNSARRACDAGSDALARALASLRPTRPRSPRPTLNARLHRPCEQVFKGCYAGLVGGFRPTAREAHMLAVVENAGGKKLAEQYRALFACFDAVGIVLPAFTDAEVRSRVKRSGFAYTVFDRDVRKMREAGDICRPYFK